MRFFELLRAKADHLIAYSKGIYYEGLEKYYKFRRLYWRFTCRTAVWICIVISLSMVWVFSGEIWSGYLLHKNAITPLLTPVAGLAVAVVALMRHFAQTQADLQRRIIESFTKATEQLASDKIEARLGGIYTLERLSNESPEDYWTVMETLTAFIRERTRRRIQDIPAEETMARYYDDAKLSPIKPPTDIAAVLAVAIRRSAKNRQRETDHEWQLNFENTNLAGADLSHAQFARSKLDGADLSGADLINADLTQASLCKANLSNAMLSNANLFDANLARAKLFRAVLRDADLRHADLVGADLTAADLSFANLTFSDLHSADLSHADLTYTKVVQIQLDYAWGTGTKLPPGLTLKPRANA